MPNAVDEDGATVPLLDGGGIELDRPSRAAPLTTRRAISDDELAHPYLATIAAVHSHWLGRAAFHARGNRRCRSGLGSNRRAPGRQEHATGSDRKRRGRCARRRLLVMEGPDVFCGPRTLDLREGAAQWFGGTRSLGLAGARERWRLDLGPAPPSAPLAGWIVPGWSEDIAIRRQPGAAAAHHIAPARSVTGLTIEPAAFLGAASHPVIEFDRPRDLTQIAVGVERLLAVLASSIGYTASAKSPRLLRPSRKPSTS